VCVCVCVCVCGWVCDCTRLCDNIVPWCNGNDDKKVHVFSFCSGRRTTPECEPAVNALLRGDPEGKSRSRKGKRRFSTRSKSGKWNKFSFFFFLQTHGFRYDTSDFRIKKVGEKQSIESEDESGNVTDSGLRNRYHLPFHTNVPSSSLGALWWTTTRGGVNNWTMRKISSSFLLKAPAITVHFFSFLPPSVFKRWSGRKGKIKYSRIVRTSAHPARMSKTNKRRNKAT